jgi:hypothetical protein
MAASSSEARLRTASGALKKRASLVTLEGAGGRDYFPIPGRLRVIAERPVSRRPRVGGQRVPTSAL